MTNYKQANPIITSNDQFGRLTGTSYFGSSIIWSPIIGGVIYFGVRYELKYPHAETLFNK
ncbi:MAG: hypothetical protein EPN82_12360 [Bacteroidetes bacterium]|nr:MAG: hypothetical protein EPN82_12360 [Bacteroidota bacterium]